MYLLLWIVLSSGLLVNSAWATSPRLPLDERRLQNENVNNGKLYEKINVLSFSQFEIVAEVAFEKFVRDHNKNYATEEERMKRYEIFKSNMQRIALLNKYEQGTATYGITAFADLTVEEFRKRHTGLKPDLVSNVDPKYEKRPLIEVADIPTNFDWRAYNVVTEVKNQGSCGSCWAFSTTGNIEGQYALKNKKLVSLSEQELVDCDKYDQGCGGGYISTAYRAIIEMGGLETESEYPYAGDTKKCHFNKTLAKVKIDSYAVLPENETLLAQWLYRHGPISIGINAMAMQFYFGGISHPFKLFCEPDGIDHGVLLVGYGVGKSRILKKTMPYWIVKNSWGAHWGEKGYYRIYRGDGSCGVNRMASSAWLTD